MLAKSPDTHYPISTVSEHNSYFWCSVGQDGRSVDVGAVLEDDSRCVLTAWCEGYFLRVGNTEAELLPGVTCEVRSA